MSLPAIGQHIGAMVLRQRMASEGAHVVEANFAIVWIPSREPERQ